jgi:hypothetical protein
MGFGGSQDEDDVGRRFFKSLEQGVGGAGAEHVDFIYDVDLEAGLVGGVINLLTEASDVVDAGVAGGVNLYDVQCLSFGYCLADVAGVARFALAIGKTIYRFSQNTRRAGFTCSSRTAEKVGVRDTAAIEGIA